MIVDIRPFLPLTVGLVAAWFVVRFLTRRNIDVTGLEAAVVGLLAGPYGQDLMTHELICSLEPMINFALGALGLGVGMRLRIDDIRSRPPDTLRITFIIGLTTIAVVGTIIYVVLSRF
jgi:NhaP-type Na+/H+ or K+/H+ antiporter